MPLTYTPKKKATEEREGQERTFGKQNDCIREAGETRMAIKASDNSARGERNRGN